MKVTLYNAISIDGFIATKDGDSDWVSEVDGPMFEAEMSRAGCIIVGRKTFEQYKGELYPVDGILNVVLTSDKEKVQDSENLLITNNSPKDILNELESRGIEEVLLIGGGTINASFLEANLIDEVILTVHPLILGDGIRLFQGIEKKIELEKTSFEELEEGLVQLRYKVIK